MKKEPRIVYKRVKVTKPHCSECGETIRGDNSLMSPYNCSCGEWVREFNGSIFYRLIKKDTE